MPDLYLLFSHELTEQQKREAYKDFDVKVIHYLPDGLRAVWLQVPPDIPAITSYIQPVKEWLAGRVKEGDYIIIQGDFGATYQMVRWAFSKGLIPIYATTERKAVEIRDGEKVINKRVFEHVRFRFYETE